MVDNSHFVPGFSYKNCTVTKVTEVQELSCRLVELKHSSQATILHIQNEDPENLFCFAFKTLPTSSNGAPHILEHTVLCGSKKYPVRDPFFSMTRRSLNTFMNAFTGADCTCYPAASQNEKDFYNLMEVYADAVFHPKLDQISFLQEGWRLEFNENKQLERKGIVYNEMKGVLASPFGRLHEKLSSLLFPNSPYGFNSGGDPEVIPTLSIEQLRQFHSLHYHPAHCLYYFYGSLPLSKHLDFLAEKVFLNIPETSSLPKTPKQPRFKKPRYDEESYPAQEQQEQGQEQLNYVSIGWLTVPCTDIKTVLSLSILDGLLMENDTSPLKRKILDSQLAKQASSSLDAELAEVPYTITLTGTKTDPSETARTIANFLQDIAKKGFKHKEIERVLHQIELQQREIVRDNAPYGLTLFWRSALAKLHGVDPLVGLELSSYFAAIEREVKKNPNYFSDLISTYLIENKHMVSVRIRPSSTLAKQEEEKERTELTKIDSKLSAKQKKQIIEESKELAKHQNKKENIGCLPKIEIKDISQKNREYSVTERKGKGSNYYFSDVFTNHISYVTVAIPLSQAVFQKSSLLKLYSLLLPQVGYGNVSWQKAIETTQEYTGGINSYIGLNPSVSDVDSIQPHLYIHGKALSKNLDRLLHIISEYAHHTRLNETKRIEEILVKHRSSLESTLISSALRYANMESDKYFSLPAFLTWQMSGREYLQNIRSITAEGKTATKTLLEDLSSLQEALLPSSGLKIIATCPEREQERIYEFFEQINLKNKNRLNNTFSYTKQPHDSYLALETGSNISFSSFAFPAMPYSSKKAPLARLLAPLLDNLVLHKRIREQGGAYGTGAAYNSSSGIFSFYSFRDPNIWKSYQAFHESLQQVARGEFKKEDLNEAKRECIQGLDDPVSPYAQAEIVVGRLLEKKTAALRQKYRTTLLQATHEELEELAIEFLKENLPQGAFTTAAGKPLLKKELPLFQQEHLSFKTIAL